MTFSHYRFCVYLNEMSSFNWFSNCSLIALLKNWHPEATRSYGMLFHCKKVIEIRKLQDLTACCFIAKKAIKELTELPSSFNISSSVSIISIKAGRLVGTSFQQFSIMEYLWMKKRRLMIHCRASPVYQVMFKKAQIEGT